jgi:uncharacterized protein YbjT (DUF2867 family)
VRVLVTGATGCIGRRLVPFLRGRGHEVVRGVRRPTEVGDRRLDLDEPATLAPAVAGVEAAFYLVHGLARGPAYAAWEADVAARFARACRDAGVARIVYLGGVMPAAGASTHLAARAATGAALRSAGVAVVELRAGMIVASDSASFVLARDIAARLPIILRPPWLRSRQRPVAIVDVVAALERALTIEPDVYGCPGPGVLGGDETLAVLGALLGRRLRFVDVPAADHHVVASLLGQITDAQPDVVAELVPGMTGDLLGDDDDGVFALLPGHVRQPFALAARLALREAAPVATPVWAWERLLRAGGGRP